MTSWLAGTNNGSVLIASGNFGFPPPARLQAAYNPLFCVCSTTGYDAQGPFGAALFTAVTQLLQIFGNDVTQGGPNTAGYTTQVFGSNQFGAAAPNVVPDPSTYALMIAGLAAVGVVARRRTRG